MTDARYGAQAPARNGRADEFHLEPGTLRQAPDPTRVERVIDLREPQPSALPRIGIVGLGYVGLPTALAFAAAGCHVVGVDASPSRLAAIAAGDVDLVPTDHARLASLRGRRRLDLGSDAARLAAADVVFICVPTPIDEHLEPDLAALQSACATVVENALPGQTLVLTSTTYAGCTRDLLADPLAARGLVPGVDVHVAFSPERIDPANTTFPQEQVSRVVGGITPACTEATAAAIAVVAPEVHPVSSPETAELTKLLENTFRAVNIALANEFAEVSRALDVDVAEVVTAAATKPYGFMPFWPGPGVGGHCIPCDPHYLLWQLRSARINAPVIAAAMNSINLRPAHVVDRVVECLADRGRPPREARVLVSGVTYKPGVEDVRESPALEILDGLRTRGIAVGFRDPLVSEVRLGDGTSLTPVHDPAAWGADVVVVHTANPDTGQGWLGEHPCVLDGTYRLGDLPGRVAL